jgi:7-cyano-7-deazaguanine synthase
MNGDFATTDTERPLTPGTATQAGATAAVKPLGEPGAVILLSGGLDSATLMGVAASEGYDIYALTFRYGQRHSRELESAAALARHYGVREHRLFHMDLGQLGDSALTSESVELPLDRDESEMTDIPSTYVPARNTILLSIALGYAEVVDADAIFIGVNAVDYSGYPDCRPEYIEAFGRLANLATRRGVEGNPIEIVAPLQHLSKAGIIAKGISLGVPYELTWSCYAGGEKACGRCDSCRLRLKGFSEAGIRDPVEYEA